MQDWQSWHEELISLVNGDFSSKKLRMLCEALPKYCFGVGARNLLDMVGKGTNAMQGSSQYITFSIPANTVQVPSVLHMKNWMQRYLSNDLTAVIIHGSLGSDEVVPYSDFDALVIIKDEVFEDKNRLARVAYRLFQARKFMYAHDPLQHHGWFVTPERALQSWPEAYLPVAALKNASHILSDVPQNLTLSPVTNQETCKQFLFGLTIGIKNDLEANLYGASLYKFKSLMSKVLLLPTLYLQSAEGNGVFKRESFDLAKKDFSKEAWSAMGAASKIRQSWPIARPLFPSFLSTKPGLIGDIIRRRSKRAVPVELLTQFGMNERKALTQLIQQMIK